jgi:Protein of unknown function (DUF3568)
MTTMNRNAVSICLLLAFLFTSGCAAVIAGAGAGAGVYTYFKGELIRTYPVQTVRAREACLSALNDLRIDITDQKTDGLITVIEAKRSDGAPIMVRITSDLSPYTEISVRTGVVGVWDKKGSELIHATIAQRLN